MGRRTHGCGPHGVRRVRARTVALRRRGRAGLTRLLRVVEGSELGRGGHTFLEREFLELLSELGYPRPRTQTVLGRRGNSLIRVDCSFVDRRVVVELLGDKFHRSRMQMQTDAERANRLQLDGFKVVQFTYTDVATRSRHLTDTLAELFQGTVKPQMPTSRPVASQNGRRRR